MKRLIFVLSFLIPQFMLAQYPAIKNGIPVDTSFTVYGTAQKMLKDFPNAKLVLPVQPEGVKKITNVVYLTLGVRKLHLDLFSPKVIKKNLPAVILIHGGGWRSGNRSMEIPMAQHLAAKEYITAVVEYRLSPEAKYPASIYDLKSALRWMRANAFKYNIDSSRIAVYGVSSGGHLAAMLGATNGMDKFEGTNGYPNHSSKVQAVIDIDGILDFTDPAESGKDNDPSKPSVGKLWLGHSYKDNPAIWIEASPLSYVTKETPPYAFINSSLPRFHAGREKFIEKLNIYHTYSEVHTIPDTPHPFWLFHPWFEETFNYIVQFLDKTLKHN